jgi:Ca2+-binding EF-hand superfamily protein
VLLFNHKDSSGNGLGSSDKLSPEAQKEMLKSPEFLAAREEFLMTLFDTNRDGFVFIPRCVRSATFLIFSVFTLNRTIDHKELAIGIMMRTDVSPRERAEFYFDVFDTNKDGSLDRSEVRKLYANLLKSMFGMVAAAVTVEFRSKPEITKHFTFEMIKELVAKFMKRCMALNLEGTLTDIVFERVDKDRNSKISKEEYVKFLANEDGIQEALHAKIAAEFQKLKQEGQQIAVQEAMEMLKDKTHF